MKHYTCDSCGRNLSAERYEAKIVVQPAFDPDELTEETLQEDNLSAVAESLAELECTGDFEPHETRNHEFQFDLCASCYSRFVKAPLGRDSRRRLDFSSN